MVVLEIELLKHTVKHLMFAWDLFREFRDSLKIAKFHTSELEKKKIIKKLKEKKPHLHVPPLPSILAIVNVSADSILSDKYGKPCFSFFDCSPQVIIIIGLKGKKQS